MIGCILAGLVLFGLVATGAMIANLEVPERLRRLDRLERAMEEAERCSELGMSEPEWVTEARKEIVRL